MYNFTCFVWMWNLSCAEGRTEIGVVKEGAEETR
jgi:hypothetical protein